MKDRNAYELMKLISHPSMGMNVLFVNSNPYCFSLQLPVKCYESMIDLVNKEVTTTTLKTAFIIQIKIYIFSLVVLGLHLV